MTTSRLADAAVAVVGIMSVCAVFAVVAWSNGAAKVAVTTSCNNLKAAAVTASQPIPKCHGE